MRGVPRQGGEDSGHLLGKIVGGRTDADTIGLMGVSSLCALGRPYICGAEGYLGVRKSHSFSSR